MSETLLTPSSIKLYGRILSNLSYKDDTPVLGCNNFLHQQLAADCLWQIGTGTTAAAGAGGAGFNPTVTNVSSVAGLENGMTVSGKTTGGNDVFAKDTKIVNFPPPPPPPGSPPPPPSFDVSPNPIAAASGFTIYAKYLIHFARIYAFSFEGTVYSLPRPSIFLVHGPGLPIVLPLNAAMTTIESAGVAAREWEFSSGDDLRLWEYEKGDFSLRLDTEAGTFEQILLAAAIRGADMGDRSGANLGIRSGANLSGANVSGANVSGANVSGANVSGANLRNR
ncbi:MAG: pentapeptide repeat-containing protein [Hyphomicrobiales bacterium]|nr:pentapeptide repeat-containing protein [Hyphomicrobiales bacterium]